MAGEALVSAGNHGLCSGCGSRDGETITCLLEMCMGKTGGDLRWSQGDEIEGARSPADSDRWHFFFFLKRIRFGRQSFFLVKVQLISYRCTV